MNIRTILREFEKGRLSIDEVEKKISVHSIEFAAGNIAQLDTAREIRKGIPEVVFGEYKSQSEIIKIVNAIIRRNDSVVVSRIQKADLPKLVSLLRKKDLKVEVGQFSTTILISRKSFTITKRMPKIGIICAGTSDIGVAEECRLIAKSMDCDSMISYDVGIAGLHRLFPALRQMVEQDVEAIIVIAGMEGALASVVSSMVNLPVIGVPTSVGYGFGSAGIAALASMLQSCTFGLVVVNIDNGIGAGAFAALIAKRMYIKRANFSALGRALQPVESKRF
ncbi:MAG: nickel pincer cofactor biosynthesis protein LarB [Nitrososphaeraceae archaeon]